MSAFLELKNSQNQSFQKLVKKLDALANPNFGNKDDDSYWQPTVDKAGNGYAIIRLLPAPDGEEDAIIRTFRHAFQGPNGWYIENSLTTLGKPDPVSEMNSKLWQSGDEGKAIVSGDPKQKKSGSKRKVEFVSGIYVVRDDGNPENNGKVFRWRYGKKIYDKIFEASNPKFPDVVAFDPFNLWTGANLKLKIRKADGYRNYDQSEWDLIEEDNVKKPRGALFNDDDKLEQIWRSAYSLQAILAPENFKSYNELKARLTKIMGTDEEVAAKDDNQNVAPAPKGKTREVNTTPPWEPKSSAPAGDADDEMKFFRQLAEEDEIPF